MANVIQAVIFLYSQAALVILQGKNIINIHINDYYFILFCTYGRGAFPVR